MYLPRPITLSGHVIMSPDGVPGVRATMRTMRALVNEGRTDPAIRSAALNLTALLPERDHLGEVRALFEFTRDRIRYVQDVLDVETLATAYRTLESAAGDCDDKSILLAALLESIGYATQFIVAGYSAPDWYEHVYLRALLPSGAWLPMDPSEPHALGWEPVDPLALMME